MTYGSLLTLKSFRGGLMSKKQEKFQKRHSLILNTAEQIIKDKGYYAFKMSDVSDYLDIAKGTLYNHFHSKEELVFNLIYPKMSQSTTTLEGIINKKVDTITKIKEIIRATLESSYFQFVLLSFPDMAALFQEKNSSKLEKVQNKMIECFKMVIEQGKREQMLHDDISTAYTAHQLLIISDPLIYSLLVQNKKMTHEDFIAHTTRNFLFGIVKDITQIQ